MLKIVGNLDHNWWSNYLVDKQSAHKTSSLTTKQLLQTIRQLLTVTQQQLHTTSPVGAASRRYAMFGIFISYVTDVCLFVFVFFSRNIFGQSHILIS